MSARAWSRSGVTLLTTVALMFAARPASSWVCWIGEPWSVTFFPAVGTAWVRYYNPTEHRDGTGRLVEGKSDFAHVTLDSAAMAQMSPGAGDTAFLAAQKRSGTVVDFSRVAWSTDLSKVLVFARPGSRASTVRVDGTSLIFTPRAAGTPETRYSLGCTPHALSVFAADHGRVGNPTDPTGTLVAVAHCRPAVVVIWRPSR